MIFWKRKITSVRIIATGIHTMMQKSANFVNQLGDNYYAIATTSTALKHMLSLTNKYQPPVVSSFLNCFVPTFRGDRILSIQDAPEFFAGPPRPEEMINSLNLLVTSEKNSNILLQIHPWRRVMPDERVLMFYACDALCAQRLKSDISLLPVVSMAILDCDTRLERQESNADDEVERKTKKSSLPEQFIQNFSFVDNSGSQMNALKMIRVHLPLAESTKSLFPPVASFTAVDWWASILRHSQKYTTADIEKWFDGGKGIMPLDIHRALHRLDLRQWHATLVNEYREELTEEDLALMGNKTSHVAGAEQIVQRAKHAAG